MRQYDYGVCMTHHVHGASIIHLCGYLEVYEQRQHVEPQVASLLHQDEHEHHRVFCSATRRNWFALNLPIIRRSVRRVKKRSESFLSS